MASAASASVWDDFVAPAWVDPDAFLFMGANPAWSPAQEDKLPDCPDPERYRCSLCGGSGEWSRDEWGNLLYDWRTRRPAFVVEPRIEKGSHAVCARCMRYGLQSVLKLRPDRSVYREPAKPDQSQENGAAAVAGAPLASPRKPNKPPRRPVRRPAAEAPVVQRQVPGHGSISVPARWRHLIED